MNINIIAKVKDHFLLLTYFCLSKQIDYEHSTRHKFNP